MTAAAYLNRKFDILAFRGAREVGETALAQTLFDSTNGGEVCTGVQKLAQRWDLEFLTIRGSMPFHMSRRGTAFLAAARRGLLRTELDVQTQFNFAALEIQLNLREEDTEDTHPEERLATATLTGVMLSTTQLSLSVRITSQAGEQRVVILPIAVTPSRMAV